jgi:hypothetical protein
MIAANDNALKFIVGRTYSVRSICDYVCVFRFEVIGRTDKTVVLSSHGKQVRRRVRMVNGAEACDPHGRYSMSPVLSAERGVQ